jgi:hypothetical protein
MCALPDKIWESLCSNYGSRRKTTPAQVSGPD